MIPDNAPQKDKPLLLNINEPHLFGPVLWQHLQTSNYGLEEKKSESDKLNAEPDLSYNENEKIWQEMIKDQNKTKRTDRIYTLRNFFLFEWFPRSPGLFFTPQAAYAREEAQSKIIKIENGFTVYDPYGKLSMLDGGVGNIRLQPITHKNDDYFFMSASSNANCHEGFPVALPEHLYNEVIEEIGKKGAVLKNLVGRLKRIPNQIDNLYINYTDVPKVYLQIEEVNEPSDKSKINKEPLSVTVASSFISNYEGDPKIYATYVGFDPSDKKVFKENVEWLENEYVIGMYKGQILTDFDQTYNHFGNAPFSLEKVMSQSIDVKDLSNLQGISGINSDQIITYQNKIKQYIKTCKLSEPPVVFISYNHNDIEVAENLYKKLSEEGFKVIWDTEKIKAGEGIESFIKESIRKSTFTISIVSTNSLKSTWVAMETILNRYAEIFKENRFIPVYIDKEFFERNFTDKTLNELEEQVQQIDGLIQERTDKNRGIEDLQDERTRMRKLIHELPEIVGQLKSKACTDISTDNFEKGISKIIKDIKTYHSK